MQMKLQRQFVCTQVCFLMMILEVLRHLDSVDRNHRTMKFRSDFYVNFYPNDMRLFDKCHYALTVFVRNCHKKGTHIAQTDLSYLIWIKICYLLIRRRLNAIFSCTATQIECIVQFVRISKSISFPESA